MCEYLAEVDLANKANRTTESDAMPPGDWIEVTPKMASRANKKKKETIPFIHPNWRDWAARVLAKRKDGHEHCVEMNATPWNHLVVVVIGNCSTSGIDERFVREWVARQKGYVKADPRAADLAELNRNDRFLCDLRVEMRTKFPSESKEWFDWLLAQEPEQYVTLDQAAAIVNRSKKTLEREKNKPGTTMPKPEVEGGGGRADEWVWTSIRRWLESTYQKALPMVFPKKPI